MSTERRSRTDVTAVIPTRNRRSSLNRTLRSIVEQTLPPDEIIIVDSSDDPLTSEEVTPLLSPLPFRVITAPAHVCVQRNAGIRAAATGYVFLCDDDIEIPRDYLRTITAHINSSLHPCAVSGLLTEPDESGMFDDGSRSLTLPSVLSAFLLQTGLWGNVNAVRTAFPGSLLLSMLKAFYRVRGNGFSLAGWPLFTQNDHNEAVTAIYGLGAAVVHRSWLLESPFDETLDSHGIGDNYGVCLGFPGDRPVTVLTRLPVKHHKVREGRIQRCDSYVLRVAALNRFTLSSPRFSRLSRAFLLYGLISRFFLMSLKGRSEEKDATMKAMKKVWADRGMN